MNTRPPMLDANMLLCSGEDEYAQYPYLMTMTMRERQVRTSIALTASAVLSHSCETRWSCDK